MLELLSSLSLTPQNWMVAVCCGLLIGMAKAGVAGTGLLFVPILAYAFGSKASTGIALPMLIIADVYAVWHYNRHTRWHYLINILPWALVGILVAMVVGNAVSGETFSLLLALTVLVCVVVMVWRDLKRIEKVPDVWWFAMLTGLAGGFATMIGNSAGPILWLYLLAMHIPKNRFIGTAAWFFLLVNLFKVPLHVFVWETITLETLTINLVLAPVILFGVFLGIRIVRVIAEKPYRILIIGSSAASALLLLI